MILAAPKDLYILKVLKMIFNFIFKRIISRGPRSAKPASGNAASGAVNGQKRLLTGKIRRLSRRTALGHFDRKVFARRFYVAQTHGGAGH
jgi:hypothetical protein